MGLAAGMAKALAAAGGVFGSGPAAPPEPRWGVLYTELGGADDAFATAIELIYEGYLLHYRESRALVLAADDVETRLLAGDCFYARGLRGVAARGDADAVGLLARLMASCSYLRSVGAPFAADDALWAYVMGGLAAQHRGVPHETVAALFDDIEDSFRTSPVGDVAAAASAAVPRLALPDSAPLLRELRAVVESGDTSSSSSSCVR